MDKVTAGLNTITLATGQILTFDFPSSEGTVGEAALKITVRTTPPVNISGQTFLTVP